MYYAGVFRCEEGTDTRIGLVSFASRVYCNWFVEVADAFCHDDFEHGNRLDARYEVRSVTMNGHDFDKWCRCNCTMVLSGDLGSLGPHGSDRMSWLLSDYHNFIEIACATAYVQRALTLLPRADMQDVIREYVDGIEGC